MSLLDYTPHYLISWRALVYRRLHRIERGRYVTRWRGGIESELALAITATRTRVIASVAHDYTSGHVWFSDPDDDLLAVADPRDTLAPLRPHVTDDQLAELRAVLEDHARWTPEALLGLFERRHPTLGSAVPPDQATWLELRSTSEPGATVLRLGPAGERELVEDRGFESLQKPARRLKPIFVPATDGDIVRAFSADVLEAVRLHERRASR